MRVSALTDVVLAIIVTQIVAVSVKDISRRVETLGTDAIRTRLRLLIVEKLMSQDLEDHERLSGTQPGGYSMPATNLVHAFPIRKYIMLPANLLRFVSGAATTGLMLWSKNWYLFCVVFATVFAQRTFTRHLSQLSQRLAMYFRIYTQ